MSSVVKLLKKMFMFIFLCWSLTGVFSADTVKSESVMEGESVTLNSGLTEIQTNDLITWEYGHSNTLIAKIKEKSQPEFRRDRLKLDHQTGSLTITNSRTTDSGLYKVYSSSTEEPLNTFNLTVYARLPVPVISLPSKDSSSSSNCSLVCSVLNASHVTLSWFKGNSLLSSISVSDLSISLSLPLEVECLDDSYSCELNNTISNQTTHPNTGLCQPCSGHLVSLMVISAAAAGFLLIVAAVFGIFCIYKKCRKIDQKVQTCDREITYADPTFYKRHKSRATDQDAVVYAGVMRR